MDGALPTQSLIILAGTGAATGLIILLILNAFVCGCIVAMCVKQRRGRRQPTYERCTPTLAPAMTPPLVRIQLLEQDDDYSEIAPRPDEVNSVQEMRLMHVQHVAVPSQEHLAMRQWGPQTNHHFPMSQTHLNVGQWRSERRAGSEDNIYASVIDSQEDLTQQPVQVSMPPFDSIYYYTYIHVCAYVCLC